MYLKKLVGVLNFSFVFVILFIILKMVITSASGCTPPPSPFQLHPLANRPNYSILISFNYISVLLCRDLSLIYFDICSNEIVMKSLKEQVYIMY